MKTIKVRYSDILAIVDDEDFDRLSIYDDWKFHCGSVCRVLEVVKNELYAQNKRIKQISMARDVMQNHIIMFDHKDRNPFNNQKANLRPATKADNSRNASKVKGTLCKYKGTYWEENRKKWRGLLTFNRKRIHLGYFNSEEECAKAYDTKAKELFGEFACLNF